jgi:hypothetical protein
MEYVTNTVIVISCLAIISIFFFLSRIIHKKDLIIYRLDAKSADLTDHLRKLKAENHNLAVKLAAEEAKKKTLTIDAIQAIENLRAGGAVLRIEAIDPGSMFMWSPSDKG